MSTCVKLLGASVLTMEVGTHKYGMAEGKKEPVGMDLNWRYWYKLMISKIYYICMCTCIHMYTYVIHVCIYSIICMYMYTYIGVMCLFLVSWSWSLIPLFP